MLAEVPGQAASNSSTALGINNEGAVVGTTAVRRRDGQIEQEAILWPVNGPPVNLNTVIPPGSAWLLQEASRINDDGDIVGSGLYGGVSRAFVLVPPGCEAGSVEGTYGYSGALPGGEVKFSGRDWKASCGPVDVSVQEANQVVDVGRFQPPSFSGQVAVPHECDIEVVASQAVGGSDRATLIPVGAPDPDPVVGQMIYASGRLVDGVTTHAAVKSGDPVCKYDMEDYDVYAEHGGVSTDPHTLLNFLRADQSDLQGLSVLLGGPRLPHAQVTFGRSPSVAVIGNVIPDNASLPSRPADCGPLASGADVHLSGYSCADGDVSFVKLQLDGAVVWVKGDLHVTGSIDGVGTVLVSGSISAGGADFQSARDNAAVAGGSIQFGSVRLG
jgi:hypothetical protein